MATLYTLNAVGRHYVKEFIRLYGNDGLAEAPYYAAADAAAQADFPAERVPVIRIEAADTYENTARTLMLDEAWFDTPDAPVEEAE